MGDHDERDALASVELGEQIDEPRGVDAVERAGGLVREQQLRLIDQRPRHGHALAFAAGEFAGPVIEPVLQAHGLMSDSARAVSSPRELFGCASVGTSTFSSMVHCGSRW